MFYPAIHIALHFLIPGLTAFLFFKHRWQQAWLIMVLTMVVDLDHLLASPIYDPNRCSINFHPLHSYPAILLYIIMAAIPKSRVIGLGLLLHMGIDLTDCI
jgi:hypothetical protein